MIHAFDAPSASRSGILNGPQRDDLIRHKILADLLEATAARASRVTSRRAQPGRAAPPPPAAETP